MAIENTQDYQIKESRLQEIKELLEGMTKKEKIDLSNVVALRDEARALAKEIKEYLKQTFESKS